MSLLLLLELVAASYSTTTSATRLLRFGRTSAAPPPYHIPSRFVTCVTWTKYQLRSAQWHLRFNVVFLHPAHSEPSPTDG